MSTVGPVILDRHAVELFEAFRQHLTDQRAIVPATADVRTVFERTDLPKDFWGFALTVYRPGKQRLTNSNTTGFARPATSARRTAGFAWSAVSRQSVQ